MASSIKTEYGTNGQTFTCTMASLANNGARQSTSVSNTTDLFVDVLVMLKVKTGASGTTSTGVVNVYVFGSVDAGTTHTEGAGTTDAAITLTAPTNARFIGLVNAVANATTYVGGPFSVAAAFNGALPEKWGIIVENKTGGALDATEGNHAKLWQGVKAQIV